MREIKFRAWDTELKQYIYQFNYNDYEISDDDGLIYITKRIETSGETPLLELEQFTGLHDKNGKEIYEGDIIKNCAGNSNKIIWHDGAFIIGEPDDEPDEIGDFYILLGECAVDKFEVIGNIHEATK